MYPPIHSIVMGLPRFLKFVTLEHLVLWRGGEWILMKCRRPKNCRRGPLRSSDLEISTSVPSHRPPSHSLQFCFSLELFAFLNKQILTSFTSFLSSIPLDCSCWLEWKQNNWLESKINRMALQLFYNLLASTIERIKTIQEHQELVQRYPPVLDNPYIWTCCGAY